MFWRCLILVCGDDVGCFVRLILLVWHFIREVLERPLGVMSWKLTCFWTIHWNELEYWWELHSCFFLYPFDICEIYIFNIVIVLVDDY